MDIKTAIKTTMQSAGKSSRDISKALNISDAAQSKFLNADFTQVKRIIEICHICGCQLQITNNDGLTITLDAEKGQ